MNRRAAAIARLEERLGHRFADRALLDRALTHASVGGPAAKTPNNDRLEFLGDRVLGLVIAEALVRRLESAEAGLLSKRLHALVSGPACARIGEALELGDALRLAGGETRLGGRRKPSILANACEALIAALFLEGGIDLARDVVLRLWATMLEAPVDLLEADPKSALQEWAAAEGRPPPVYRVLDRDGPAHRPLFSVEARIEGAAATVAQSGSLRGAEKAAALRLLRELGVSRQ